MHSATIAVMATLDTKGVEAEFVAKQIQQLGHEALLIDTGVVGMPTAKAAITREEVALAGGVPLGELLKKPSRERSAPVMAAGATAIVTRLGCRREDSRHHFIRRDARDHFKHESDACPAVWPSQGDGIDHCFRKRGSLGGYQRHHHDVFRRRYPWIEPPDEKDPGQRGGSRLRHGLCQRAIETRQQASGRGDHRGNHHAGCDESGQSVGRRRL